MVFDTERVTAGGRDVPRSEDTGTPSYDFAGQYQLTRGLPTDQKGQAPASQHCGHWFDPHPDFADGGLVAMAWYTSGVRFLEVAGTGEVQERGFWQPLPGVSSAAFWVSEDVVWVTDYTARGIDVLRFDAGAEPQGDASAPGEFIPAGSATERRTAAAVDAAHEAGHHTGTSVAELAQAWVCSPVAQPAPVGRPDALGAQLRTTALGLG